MIENLTVNNSNNLRAPQINDTYLILILSVVSEFIHNSSKCLESECDVCNLSMLEPKVKPFLEY